MQKAFALLLLSLNLSACLEGTPKNAIGTIPPVSLKCHSAQHADCVSQKSGKSAYIGLTSNLVGCGPHLMTQGINEQIHQIFDATGTAVVTNKGPFLVGTVNTWYNFGNVRLFSLPEGDYMVCAFIDQNNDQRWSNNEPLSEGLVQPDSREVILDLWN